MEKVREIEVGENFVRQDLVLRHPILAPFRQEFHKSRFKTPAQSPEVGLIEAIVVGTEVFPDLVAQSSDSLMFVRASAKPWPICAMIFADPL